MIINDLIPAVIDKLRDRQDVTTTIPYWIASAIIDLTESYPFEELAFNGAPVVNFNPGQSEYTYSYFLGQETKVQVTRILSWFRFFSTTGSRGQVSSDGSVGSAMKYREVQVVEPMSVISGLPFVWSQVGQTILVGFNPDQAYATYVRFQEEHPFVGGEVVPQNQQLGNTRILMPRDWREILIYAAAEKGCDNVGMDDIGTLYHQKLWGNGDPDPRKRTIGLIEARQSQQQRNTGQNERQLQPMVRRIT